MFEVKESFFTKQYALYVVPYNHIPKKSKNLSSGVNLRKMRINDFFCVFLPIDVFGEGPVPKNKGPRKGPFFYAEIEAFRGLDGTRTRDPLRDRQVF